MKLNRWVDRSKALLLLLLSLFLAEKYVNGTVGNYINAADLSWLIVTGAVLFFVFATAYNVFGNRAAHEDEHEHHHHDHSHDHDHAHATGWRAFFPLAVVAIPLLLGVLVPYQPLDASDAKDVSLDPGKAIAARNSGDITTISTRRTVLDWARAIASARDIQDVYGQEVDVIGFVYRDGRFAVDQFMVTRFVMTCCVADSMPIGLVVQTDNAADFKTDTWVRVKGVFAERVIDGSPRPAIVAREITFTSQPEQPYLYQ